MRKKKHECLISARLENVYYFLGESETVYKCRSSKIDQKKFKKRIEQIKKIRKRKGENKKR